MLLYGQVIIMVPNFDAIYMFFLSDRLNMTKADLGDLATCGVAFIILFMYLYENLFIYYNPRHLFIITIILLWALNVQFMMVLFDWVKYTGLSEKMFCMINSGAIALVSELNFLPLITILISLTIPNLEATFITLFTGIFNLTLNLS